MVTGEKKMHEVKSETKRKVYIQGVGKIKLDTLSGSKTRYNIVSAL